MWVTCFFFNDTATTQTYTYCHTLSHPDALPIYRGVGGGRLRALGHPPPLRLGGRGLGDRLLLLQGLARQRRPAGRRRAMILFPAIDLKDGQAVRLLRG